MQYLKEGDKVFVKLNQNTAHQGADYLPADGIYTYLGVVIKPYGCKFMLEIPNSELHLEVFPDGVERIALQNPEEATQ